LRDRSKLVLRRAFALFPSSKRRARVFEGRDPVGKAHAMNETILALMSAMAIYGLSSLALSRPSVDPQDDWTDTQAEEPEERQSLPPRDDDTA
jgi:hypothetical protein